VRDVVERAATADEDDEVRKDAKHTVEEMADLAREYGYPVEDWKDLLDILRDPKRSRKPLEEIGKAVGRRLPKLTG
jgi:hypothetical protein